MRQPVSLRFEKLTYTVETSTKGARATLIDKLKGATVERKLLIDINANVTSGHVLAILGPSGAGKVRPCPYVQMRSAAPLSPIPLFPPIQPT
jgi:ABC-type polysaccharide/polyol phosphate transport system ATPase subunit